MLMGVVVIISYLAFPIRYAREIFSKEWFI